MTQKQGQNSQIPQREIEEKQLSDRTKGGWVRTSSSGFRDAIEFDRIGLLGESKLRRRTRPIAEMGCSVWFRDVDDLKSE